MTSCALDSPKQDNAQHLKNTAAKNGSDRQICIIPPLSSISNPRHTARHSCNTRINQIDWETNLSHISCSMPRPIRQLASLCSSDNSMLAEVWHLQRGTPHKMISLITIDYVVCTILRSLPWSGAWRLQKSANGNTVLFSESGRGRPLHLQHIYIDRRQEKLLDQRIYLWSCSLLPEYFTSPGVSLTLSALEKLHMINWWPSTIADSCEIRAFKRMWLL